MTIQKQQGPLLETLTHRLSECPQDFLLDPTQLNVLAIVNDTIEALGGAIDMETSRAFNSIKIPDNLEKNRLQLTAITCWLLHDDWFVRESRFASQSMRFITERLPELARLVQAPKFVSEADRREELARLCLSALHLVPQGETEEKAMDRLTTLSSAERQRVLRESRAAEERALAIRKAMEKKRAEEAAAAYARE